MVAKVFSGEVEETNGSVKPEGRRAQDSASGVVETKQNDQDKER